MSVENKLGLTSSDDLAREEERLSKKKAVELFENGMFDTLPAGKFSTLNHKVDVAYQMLTSGKTFAVPQYVKDAIGWLRG